MGHAIHWETERVALGVDWESGPVVLSYVQMDDVRAEIANALPFAQIITATSGHTLASSRLVHSAIGDRLRYREHRCFERDGESCLEVELVDEDLEVTLKFAVAEGHAGVKSVVSIRNVSSKPCILRSVASWASGIGSQQEFRAWTLRSARSDWLAESRWTDESIESVEFPRLSQVLTGHDPRGEHRVVSTGSWSTGKYLPTAALAGPEGTWLWQIEHNGAWRWEVGEDTAGGYFSLSGPTEDDHSWMEILLEGEKFDSVPVTVTLAADFESAAASMTDIRRGLIHKSEPIEPLVVFNDYMNALNGDPTTSRLLPLIDAAAGAGAEIFLIDAGWYDDGFDWWDSVGEWTPSKRRFPDGLGEVINRIRDLGMTPGLWVEPEVVGVRSPIADLLPDEAFFLRRGQRIVEQGRYHLDFRHRVVLDHVDEVIDRLVRDFGVGYFKFDYNINPGAGTDYLADSLGSGLLHHNRAYLAWMRATRKRHPNVLFENCGSGGMRADYATLAHFDVQSSTDQQDEIKLPAISSSTLASVLPEQAAFWAYPQLAMGLERVAFCLSVPMLGRYLLSGYLNELDDSRQKLVAEAVEAYKSIRDGINHSHPFWPSGIPYWDDSSVSVGLHMAERDLVTVWNRTDDAKIRISLRRFVGCEIEMKTIFPRSLPEWHMSWDALNGVLELQPSPGPSARTLQITAR